MADRLRLGLGTDKVPLPERFEIEGIPPSIDTDRFDVDAVPQGTPGLEVIVIDHVEQPTPD